MNFAAARHNMVESQLRTNKVTDEAVLEAFDSIPREAFMPGPLRAVAYVDEDLPIGHGRYLMEPMVLARLIQLAQVQHTDTVLDLACGTGYSTAILSRLAASVVGVEDQAQLAQRARETLASLSIDNVLIFEGDPAKGCAQQGPYDVILVNGMVEVLPSALGEQLLDGGRLVAVERRDGVGRATLRQRAGGGMAGRVAFEAAVPLLPGFAAPPQFVF
jgi:protein-L-isoaspartate(D-aspartate) O-methyltransferase